MGNKRVISFLPTKTRSIGQVSPAAAVDHEGKTERDFYEATNGMTGRWLEISREVRVSEKRSIKRRRERKRATARNSHRRTGGEVYLNQSFSRRAGEGPLRGESESCPLNFDAVTETARSRSTERDGK